MAADMSGEQMQAKITAARREAEGLKDKIKRRKDELADTTRMSFSPLCRPDGSVSVVTCMTASCRVLSRSPTDHPVRTRAMAVARNVDHR